ncbi:hypothetical protein BN970_05348 [Mycolicibacterium conceptionense]|uniref:Uncharacterized protein n=1 Tax=Mycolicibacterium conceptionense TaxID=451644 RepID=A0A0U1DTF7_9MYCO|nr:hypothetical protein BN970_05348 [Mycolicibacterium conceptionense]
MAEDLKDRDDVELLLWRFYGKALSDPVLAEPFAQLRAKGLRAHLPSCVTSGRPCCSAPGSITAAPDRAPATARPAPAVGAAFRALADLVDRDR